MDMNLLVALNALLETRHVSHAAERIGISQPAMSNALSRLRQFLNDPVLVRDGRNMVPTELALQLESPVRTTLKQLEDVLFNRPAFDPESSTMTFHLAATDHMASLLMPQLCRDCETHAPGVRLDVSPLSKSVPREDLAKGRIDLALRHLQGLPEGFYQQTLLKDKFVCLVRENHPEVRNRLTLKKYLELKHVLVSPWGGMRGLVDDLLDDKGLKRKVHVVVPSFMLAPPLVAETDYIVTTSEAVARIACKRLPVKMLKLPLEMEAKPYGQFWHERSHHSPAHRWLRNMVQEAARKACSD
jgi:DNA-binding transcriptional LysR family regulator